MKILLKGINIPNCSNSNNNNNNLNTNTIKTLEIKENIKILNSPNELKKLINENFQEFSKKIQNENYEIYTNGKYLLENKQIILKNLQIFEIKFTIIGGKV
jgi:hypothetical protein